MTGFAGLRTVHFLRDKSQFGENFMR